MIDCLIVGGGIIGLSAAYELVRRGATVRIIDDQRSQRTASWAAAGILPPPISRATHDAMEQLRDMSHELYPGWCERLQQESGIDVQFVRSGGIYVARRVGETASLAAALQQWQVDGVELHEIDTDWIQEHEPALNTSPPFRSAYLLPDESTVCPPKLLSALQQCLQESGVQIDRDVRLHGWNRHQSRVESVSTSSGTISTGHICVATGPWSHETLFDLEIDLPVEPRRGQMLMWEFDEPIIHRVINEGLRYLVPRPDGKLLAGSTVEDVGFDDQVTEAGLAELTQFANGLIPALEEHPPTRNWTGLRPFSRDGFPYLGRLPNYENVLVATGHFRSGIHLAPATAQVIGDLLAGMPVECDLQAFAPTRT